VQPAAALLTRVRLLAVGEQALCVEFGTSIDERTNARVHALAHAITHQPAMEVIEVVPSYRSLLVVFDPLQTPRERLVRQITALIAQPSPLDDERAARCVVIPVCYGGELGPDLGFVAGHNGLCEQDVVEAHAAPAYRVYMLGFTPGFPYLGGMSPRIAAPRLPQPRARVAAGSVGIAGEQTGVYPVASPGGWRLIGRTPLRLFDPGSAQPFLLSAGDHLRFAPIGPDEYADIERRVQASEYVPQVLTPLSEAQRDHSS
jgi:inhibitor of KinA